MFNLKSAWAGLCSAVFICNLSYAAEIGHVPISLNNTPHIQHNTTIGLKPISDSYKLARAQFLPEFEDSDIGWAGRNLGGAYNKNDCSSYPLSSCSSNGKCTKCPVGAGYRLDSCNTGYTKNGDTCTKNAVFCETNATTFLNNIPADYTCDKVKTSTNCTAGKPCDVCFSSCHKINCSGYSLDYDTLNKTAMHIADTKVCPACQSSSTNCARPYSKITRCVDGYKIANNGTSCIALDDTCPNGYYKSCETGTLGDPKYTEKGTACYQCKPKTCTANTCSEYTLSSCPSNGSCSTCTIKNTDCSTGAIKYKLDSCDSGYTKSGNTCIKQNSSQIGNILYSDMSTSFDVISGKTPIGVVFNPERKLAVALNEQKKYWATEKNIDIPDLPNINSESTAKADWNGKNNTEIIIAYAKANGKSYPAAEYANSYTTEGTKAGDWYVPALGELNAIYENREVLNATMTKVNGTQLRGAREDTSYFYYWSSTEGLNGIAWKQTVFASNAYTYIKYELDFTVRPVIKF